MPLTAAAVEALAARCATAVAPATLVAVAHAESRFEPLAIGVNGPTPQRIVPTTPGKATVLADQLIRAGRNVDLGLVQINSQNLKRLGLSTAAAFDLCRNLSAGAQVLGEGYRRADPVSQGAQAALRVALSYYNTGRPDRGFRNGYVGRVTGWSPRATSPMAEPSPASPPPAWDVFGKARAATSAFIIVPPAEGDLK